jgi:multiple antibiotic resistance protein
LKWPKAIEATRVLAPGVAAAAFPYQASGVNNAYSALAANTLPVVGALFPIVNPLGNTPIFLTLTRGLLGPGRARLARAIALNGLVLMVVWIFIGTYILAFVGISLPVVQVGGGLVVISTGWALLRQPDDDGTTEDLKKPCHDVNYMRQAFYPLTMPLTVGPGSIAVSITLGANRTQSSGGNWLPIAGLVIGALVIAIRFT